MTLPFSGVCVLLVMFFGKVSKKQLKEVADQLGLDKVRTLMCSSFLSIFIPKLMN